MVILLVAQANRQQHASVACGLPRDSATFAPVPEVAIDASALATVETYPGDAVPVFVGHYWLTGAPTSLAVNVACTDYSVARGGKLVAYRWDGESVLSADKFHWVGS